ncbi:MAG TPA: HAMP domain-containing sensor histidine kinase [Kofleriaceae bacterium]|nr:HAMP domain-containing sensor histidine kinase [Kofleriaceae bacterium]HMG55166.1 HAMP domain-containing sensor histidine kinase [Kofleriaceae bacterium]
MTQPPPPPPRPPRRKRLVYRVYGFAAVLAIAIMAALLILPRYTRTPRFLEPHAALVQYLIERWSLRSPHELDVVMARIETRVRGKLSLFDAGGKLLRSNVDPPLDPPTQAERRVLTTDKWSLDLGRIVVRSDDGSMIGVYAPDRLGFPWSYVIPLGAMILVLVGLASVWFSRRMARPLDQLAVAARRFGSGDTAARANLTRDDEVGDVGRAFDEMADRTASVLHSQRQLMGDVSHELRTPLARIRVALELAAEDPIAATDVLADVGADLDEIDQLIGDILTTARLDGDHVRIDREATAVSELVDRASRRFAARHPGRMLDRVDDTSRSERDGDRAIQCDPVLLRRALDNLLDNAAKYSDAGTPVVLAVQPNGTTIAFEIVDRGIGMSPSELDRAFTPFWRADGSRTRKTGGVGLGLALARRIARAHGGDVTLASHPGQGTTARLEVPLI